MGAIPLAPVYWESMWESNVKMRTVLPVFFAVVTLVFNLTGCLPPYLAKYQQQPHRTKSESETQLANTSSRSNSHVAASPVARGEMLLIDKNTFHVSASVDRVWDSLMDVLIKNYNVTAVDRKSGMITTEWDTFYLEKETYRNKLSIRIKTFDAETSEMVVYNNLEVLKSSLEAKSEVWLPVEGGEDEIQRIAKNVAILLGLNEPKTQLSPVAIKGSQEEVPENPPPEETPVPPDNDPLH